MPSDLDARNLELLLIGIGPTELQPLLVALHAAAEAGDAEVARMLQILRLSRH